MQGNIIQATLLFQPQFSNYHSHITLQPKTGFPLKLSRVESGPYLDWRPPGKTRLLLEEVLVRPAEGAHPVVCVGSNTPQYSDWDTIELLQSRDPFCLHHHAGRQEQPRANMK